MYISEKQQKFTQNNDRFAFLDGFRGTLALVWVLHHISVILEFPMLDVFSTIAQRYAITGFFLLTSFLLTYRLLKEFHQKPNSNIFITTVQFSIRRFFRVYVVVVIFAFVYSYKKEYRTAVNIITLGNPGANILWTIASGIKYYFVLILICILFHCSQKNVRLYLVLTGLIWTVFDQFFNLLDISWEKNLIYTSPESHFLKSHFAVFFIGSQLAMALVLAESNESFMKFIKEEKNQLFLNVFSIVFGVYSFIFETNLVSYTEDYNARSKSAIFWSITLLACLLSDSSKNYIVRLLDRRFLKIYGKYNFGNFLIQNFVIYLFRDVSLLFQLPFPFREVGVVLACFYVGVLFYYLLEHPMIKISRFICSKLEPMNASKLEETQTTNVGNQV